MKHSPQRNQNKSKRSAHSAPYRCPSPRCSHDEEDLDILRMASRSAKPTSLIRRTAPANFGYLERKASLESISSVSTSRSFVDDRSKNNRYDRHSSRKDTPRKVIPEPKGNDYVLAKIVDYLLTQTLASCFRNTPNEDRTSNSSFANVTKFLMGASVVHLGGKHNLYSHSYLKSLRKGLSHASRKHGKHLQFQEGVGSTSRMENLKEIERFVNDVGIGCENSDIDTCRTERKRFSGNPKKKTSSKKLKGNYKKRKSLDKYKGNHKNQKRSPKFAGNKKRKSKSNHSRWSRRVVETNRKEVRDNKVWSLKDVNCKKRTTRNPVKYTRKSSSKKFKEGDKENKGRRDGNRQKLVKPHSREFEVRLCNFEDLKNRKFLRQSVYLSRGRSDTDSRSERSGAAFSEPDNSVRRVPSLTTISGV